MRRVVLDDTGSLDGMPVAICQQGPDEVWLINPHAPICDVVKGCNDILIHAHEQPRELPPFWRMVRWAISPLCRRVHVCDY